MKINRIFITHWHGDHSLGIGGILQSLSAGRREKTLHIYGPKGSKNRVSHIMKSFSFDMRFKVIVKEIDAKVGETVDALRTKRYKIAATRVKHGIPCLAFSFQEKAKRKINLEYTKKFGLERHKVLGELQRGKTITWKGRKITPEKGTIVIPGKKVTYIVDTSYYNYLSEFARDSDLLICEATFLSELEAKAEEYLHLTVKQTAQIAKNANVRKLILTHFSQRYKEFDQFKKEARKIFKNTEVARDFMKLTLR